MPTLEDVRQASFWHEQICLECHSRVGEAEKPCPECGSDAVVPATSILSLCNAIAQEAEDVPF